MGGKRTPVPTWALGLGVVLVGVVSAGVKFDWFGSHTTSAPPVTPATLRRSLPRPDAPVPGDVDSSRSPSTAKTTRKGFGLKIE